MKKTLRLIALVLSLLILCFAFCGCDALDEARKNHGIWQDEEKTVILLDGKEYKKLPECEFLSPSTNNDYNGVYVTNKDVPLLCKEMFGEPFYRSDDKIFLVNYPYDREISDDVYAEETYVYCVADRYDEINKRISDSPKMEELCYTYYDSEYNEKTYFLTKSEEEAISTALFSGEVLYEGDLGIGDIYEECAYAIDLYHCSEDGIFKFYACELIFKGIDIYLRQDADYSKFEYSNKYYPVPDELEAIMYQIAEKYIENNSMENY